MEKKIKIIYILPSMARGGAERFLLDLLSNLDRDKFSPSVILFKTKGVWFDELSSLNLPIYTLTKTSLLGIGNFWKIYQIIREEKPQIVHTQLGGDIRGRLAAALAHVKIIISTEQNINKSESWWHHFAKIISSFWVDSVVAISPAVASDMHARYFLASKKCALIIPNGINFNKFTYQENRPTQEPILVGAIGRLTKQKGFDLLISAWQKINPQNAKLLIAGSGEEWGSLQAQIKSNKLEKSIELIGDISDTPNFYSKLNLLVIPSRWEGLGIVALEAGASGIPIIANQIDGLKDIISLNTGWPVDLDEPESLGGVLKVALDSLETELQKSKQRALRTLVESKYNIINVSQEYSKLYLKLIQEKYEDTTS